MCSVQYRDLDPYNLNTDPDQGGKIKQWFQVHISVYAS